MRNLAHAADCLRGDGRDLVELVARMRAQRAISQSEKRPVPDDQEILAEAVVQLSRNALPFILLGFHDLE